MFKYFLYSLREEIIPLGVQTEIFAVSLLSHVALRCSVSFLVSRESLGNRLREAPAEAVQAGGCPGGPGYPQWQRRPSALEPGGSPQRVATAPMLASLCPPALSAPCWCPHVPRPSLLHVGGAHPVPAAEPGSAGAGGSGLGLQRTG